MKTEIQLHVINIIREYRNNINLSQAGLTDILDVSYGLVGNIESTKLSHKYTIPQLYQLSEYFKIPFEKLFLTDVETNMNKRNVIDLLIKKIVEYEK